MPFRASNWDELLVPVINEFFELGFRQRPMIMDQLYNVQSTNIEQKYHTGIGGLSPDVWTAFNRTGRAGVTDFNKGYKKTFTQVQYPVQVQIEKKAIELNQYSGLGVSDQAERLGLSARQFVDIQAASTFVNAFSSSYNGADGVPLCDDSHPHSPDDTGTTQDNDFSTLALTNSNLSTVRTNMMKFTDDKGNRLGVVPDTLLVPPDLQDTAIAAIGDPARAPLDPDSANNALNAQAGRYNLIVWNQLTDANAWFLIDSILMRQSLYWYWAAQLQETLMTVYESTTEVVVEGKLMFDFGFTDWRWIGGSNPS